MEIKAFFFKTFVPVQYWYSL